MKRLLSAVLCVAAAAGCERAVIKGTVYDIRGEALPGVAVTVEGAEFQALTNALGEYRVPFVPGAVTLHYAKTGFTPGALELFVERPRSVAAAPVSLWALPIDKGVYLFENYRFRETARMMPEAFVTIDNQTVHAVTRWADVDTRNSAPIIMCYKMPPHDVRFSRLELTELMAKLPRGGVEEKEVWSSIQTIPVGLDPIDEPQRLLMQVRLPGPLEVGTYAVHWGALDGRTVLDERIFTFNVIDLTVVAGAEDAPEEAAESSETSPAPAPPPPAVIDDGPAGENEY